MDNITKSWIRENAMKVGRKINNRDQTFSIFHKNIHLIETLRTFKDTNIDINYINSILDLNKYDNKYDNQICFGLIAIMNNVINHFEQVISDITPKFNFDFLQRNFYNNNDMVNVWMDNFDIVWNQERTTITETGITLYNNLSKYNNRFRTYVTNYNNSKSHWDWLSVMDYLVIMIYKVFSGNNFPNIYIHGLDQVNYTTSLGTATNEKIFKISYEGQLEYLEKDKILIYNQSMIFIGLMENVKITEARSKDSAENYIEAEAPYEDNKKYYFQLGNYLIFNDLDGHRSRYQINEVEFTAENIKFQADHVITILTKIAWNSNTINSKQAYANEGVINFKNTNSANDYETFERYCKRIESQDPDLDLEDDINHYNIDLDDNFTENFIITSVGKSSNGNPAFNNKVITFIFDNKDITGFSLKNSIDDKYHTKSIYSNEENHRWEQWSRGAYNHDFNYRDGVCNVLAPFAAGQADYCATTDRDGNVTYSNCEPCVSKARLVRKRNKIFREPELWLNEIKFKGLGSADDTNIKTYKQWSYSIIEETSDAAPDRSNDDWLRNWINQCAKDARSLYDNFLTELNGSKFQDTLSVTINLSRYWKEKNKLDVNINDVIIIKLTGLIPYLDGYLLGRVVETTKSKENLVDSEVKVNSKTRRWTQNKEYSDIVEQLFTFEEIQELIG